MLILWLLLLPLATPLPDCSRAAYEDCIRIGDPLLRQPHLVFPDTLTDIETVCTTWNRFVDCLKRYTDRCFTDQQRRIFNKAVENPIESVHEMCTRKSYQREYLEHAPCIRSTVTEQEHCGEEYGKLVENVDMGEVISKGMLCCSHDRFKQCVIKETRRLCDRGAPDGPALKFAEHLIEKALSFMQDQCSNYIPNSGDCTSLTTDSQTFSDPLTISSSEVYPWSTVQEIQAKEVLPTKITPPKISTTTWLPSTQDVSSSLGVRTRPASFGRANSWSDIPSVSTAQITPEATPTRPDWVTAATQQTENSQITWYPAAGSQLDNSVDEPNQQGLTKPQNNSGRSVGGVACLLLTTIVFIIH